MPQTLMLSTTDRNCRPTWHKFQPQGEKEYTIHSTPFQVLWQNLRPIAPNQEKPRTAPYHSLIYLGIYISLVHPDSSSLYELSILHGLGSRTSTTPNCGRHFFILESDLKLVQTPKSLSSQKYGLGIRDPEKTDPLSRGQIGTRSRSATMLIIINYL